MITKSFDIKHLLHIIILMFACSILMCATTYAQSNDTIKAQSPSLYELRHERYIKRWNKLIPNQATVQYAGSIGMFSAGAGWRYGRNHHWETDLLLTRVRDNILKSKEQKNIQPTKGGHKMVTCQNYVSLFYCQITSCPSDGGIS